jgi:hypothetical protein
MASGGADTSVEAFPDAPRQGDRLTASAEVRRRGALQRGCPNCHPLGFGRARGGFSLADRQHDHRAWTGAQYFFRSRAKKQFF